MADFKSIRNIAIIAHVDHGKTTLVDHLLKQSGLFRENQHVEDRLMDSMSLERERGITIAAKNASFIYEDIKINIVDTPGHADFGGEVERTLNMVDGCILLVDASEGPLPQTRFVLTKALEQNKKIITVVNKIDRSDSRVEEVVDEIFSLFIDVGATDAQADFLTLYAVARDGIAVENYENWEQEGKDLTCLFRAIIDHIPEPEQPKELPLKILVSNLDYSEYVGRLAIGRVAQGRVRVGETVVCMGSEKNKKFRVTSLLAFEGTQQQVVEELAAGDIAIVAGFESYEIGDTISDAEDLVALPRIEIDEPTVGIEVSVNDSPYAGLEGTQVTSTKISERLTKELLHNVSLRLEKRNNDSWQLIGRGELQLAVVIENMRREGFEVMISKPQVQIKEIDGERQEPVEMVVIDVDNQFSGVVNEKLGNRRGILRSMNALGAGRTRLEFRIPSRGLIGYRSEFMTDTRGTGLLNARFEGYEAVRGEIRIRTNGPIVSDRKGDATGYALSSLEPRGKLFIKPGTKVYMGMVVGEHAKSLELSVNVTKEKKLTNVRASGTDDAVKLSPVIPMTLEQAMEWIRDDELIEITPKEIRIRMRELDHHKRK